MQRLLFGFVVLAGLALASLWRSSEEERRPALAPAARAQGRVADRRAEPPLGERVAVAPGPSSAPALVEVRDRKPPVDGLAGTVVDEVSGQPVETFRLYHSRAGDGAPLSAADPDPSRGVWRRDAEGWFRLAGLPPGTYSVLVDPRASGYEKAVIHDVRVPAPSPLVVRVGRGAHVEGRLLDGADRSIGGAEIFLERASKHSGPPVEPIRRTTDEAGRFLFTRLEPGAYRLATTSAQRHESAVFRVDERAGVQQDMRLSAASALRIAIVDRARRPLDGATVLLASRTGEVRNASADPAGKVEFRGLAAGRYALEVRRPGFRPRGHEVDLSGSDQRPVEVVLARTR